VLAARRIFLRAKGASDCRPGANDLEEALPDGRSLDRPRGTRPAERKLLEAIHRHALERSRVTQPVIELAGDSSKGRPPGVLVKIRTRRSDSSKGRGRRRTAFTMLKIAVFAPMPSASTLTTATANDGVRDITRNA
jgi:hypothetical protein